MLQRLICPIAVVALASTGAHAQVTTSSVTGTVKDAKAMALAGATITATHVPSGTVYTTVSNKNGVFTIPNMRVGGPYQLVITYVGQEPFRSNEFTLELGQPFNINAVLGQSAQTLENVVVTGTRARRVTQDRTGASTNISNRQITTLPTISRSITDFTRLTPQANGTSFGGRDGRYNNVQIDGANLNNNFGLSNDPLPGGGNPISLDAIDEISVNIAPFDVRQANFTGAGISAVTKSGTNTFHGSVYNYFRNQNMNGSKVAGQSLPPAQASYNNIYGATIGGPIIKNKLFFFFNAEHEERSATLNFFYPTGGSGAGNTSSVPVSELQRITDTLRARYGYDPGQFDNFSSDRPITNRKLLGKIDWNISKKHRLTLKYSDFINSSASLPSQSGGINGASSSGIVTYGPKFSNSAMAFGNTVYFTEDKVRTGTFELNSRFSTKFSNQLLGTITKINTDKTRPGATFPFVDILGGPAGAKNNYISFGNEPFNGNNNKVVNDVYTITDNFTYYSGKHTITAGGSYEYQRVGNMFMAGSQGYYVYGSPAEFYANAAPRLFSITYSLVPGEDAVYSANLKIGQLGLYAQDEINVNPNLKVTAGFRVDRPIYLEQPLENPAISALTLKDINGNNTNYTTGAWPKASWYLSPRVGFRWDVNGDKRSVLRGGTGVFTGRIPFVYLTNVPSNSGMYQFGALITNPADLANFPLNSDPHAYNPFYNTGLNPAQFPTKAGTAVPTGAYALTANNFKFPQVWRSNLAYEKQLGNGWNVNLEAIYTKDINAVYMFNANQGTPDTVVMLGTTERPRYSSTAARKVNAASGNAIVLDNTAKGSSFSLTAQVAKSFTRHFYGSLAYTYTYAADVTANPGSQANSVWSANPTSGTQNTVELAYSNFAVPHRLIATLSYRAEYLKHLGTTISLFYEGAHAGTYSYIYNGDINNDGNSADLMYIPRDASEIKFKDGVVINGTTFSAKQQSDLFFQYVEQDPYLRKHKGQVAERNGALYPWYNKVDVKFVQDLFVNVGRNRHTLQFTADITNFLNLLNNEWGVRQFYTINNPLRVESVTNGVPTFSLTPYNNNPLTRTFVNNISTASAYNIQLGLRYMF